MAVVRLTPSQVVQRTRETLGLSDSGIDPVSLEGFAASVRRAASFMCPTTPTKLIAATVEVYAGLPESDDEFLANVASVVPDLVGYGDLLELGIEIDGRIRRQLFLGEPAYVRRSDHSALLVGIRPEGAPLVSEVVNQHIEYRGHARVLTSDSSVRLLLDSEGLIELKPNQWMNAPARCSARELVETYMERLAAAGEAGDVAGVTIIDPHKRVTYYRGRLRALTARDSGTYVARRPQAFGADLWCFVEVLNGKPVRLIDLPILSPLATGADEAWRLQAARDAAAFQPQHIRVRDNGRVEFLDVFSPLPSWARKRLDTVGETLDPGYGALFSYSLPKGEGTHETLYLNEMMWTFTDWVGGPIDDH